MYMMAQCTSNGPNGRLVLGLVMVVYPQEIDIALLQVNLAKK